MNVNLRGSFVTAQEAAKIVVAQAAGGRMAVISSVNQDNIVPLPSHYRASKGGVRRLARGDGA